MVVQIVENTPSSWSTTRQRVAAASDRSCCHHGIALIATQPLTELEMAGTHRFWKNQAKVRVVDHCLKPSSVVAAIISFTSSPGAKLHGRPCSDAGCIFCRGGNVFVSVSR